MKKLFLFTLLLMYSVVTIAQEKPEPVSPFYDGNLLTGMDLKSNENVYTDGFATLLEAFTFGGNRLVAMQYTDGGWGWPLNAPPTYGNILGPIAMGLAQAYQQTGIVAQRTALLSAGAYLLTKTNNFSPSDGYLAAQLDKIFGGTTYTDHVATNFYAPLAAGTYNRNGAGTLYNTADYVNLIRTTRSGDYANMAAWDIGMGLVGAAMCGASTTAWIDGVKAEINELDGENYYDVIGLAGAVYGLAFVNEDFDPTAGQHAAASNINDLAATLASYQIAGGGFAWNQAWVIPNDGNETIQETAYAILALNEVNRTLYITNIEGAADYMMAVQLVTGGWENYVGSSSGENNEITGEALWGMSVAYPAPVYNSTKDVYYPIIQRAIDDANHGDIIVVAAGTYNYVNQGSPPPSGLIKVTKGVTIKAVDGTRPIIDGSGFDGVFKIHPSALIPGNVVIIEGFEIKGDATTGIAITMQGCFDVVPANVIIRDNWIHGMVGGIDFWGAGLYLPPGWTSALAKVEITNNKFYDLVISGSDQGVGVMIEDPANWLSAGNDYAVKIENNEFYNIPSNGANPGVGIVIPRANDPWEAANVYIAGNSFTVVPIGIAFMDGDVTTAQIVNNSFVSNAVLGVLAQNIDNSPLDAELNWWGTAVESEIQAKISGDVDYDPWVGKAETVPVTQISPQEYNFPNAGVKMIFSTLPSGGGNVTVARYNEVPAGFPGSYDNVGMWLDIISSMPNYSFDVTIKVDVTGLGFDNTQSVMYFNSATNTWVAIPGGSYSAPYFTFTTNHFTPFSFINTPETAYNVYISSSTSGASGFIYPNDDWGYTLAAYEPNDWDFTAPISLYIVPEIGSVFGASDITIQWDNTLFSYAGVDKTGGIYDGVNFQIFYSQFGNTDQVTIQASTLGTNFTIGTGDYIAKLNLNVLKPGFGSVSFTSLDFRAYNGGIGGFEDVYVTGNNAQVKSYLGDVASAGDQSTGDGLININDLSPWALSYWSGVGSTGMANYKVKYDVGPTTTNTVYGSPNVDARIQFEDLVIFSMSYGLSASHVYPKLNAEPKEPVDLQLGSPIIAGNQTRVPLFVSGGVQNVRAMNLTFAGTFGKLVSVEKGALLNELVNPVMVMSNTEGNQVYVDLAVFGANELGISKEGEVLTLVFEGNTNININTANIRNILNGAMKVNISGSVESVPTEFALLQNYPNPFNPTTMINYYLPKQAMVEISLFNALGEKVATLVNELKEAGKYNVEFNGAGYSSGIYFYQIKANDFVSVKKMILMK